MILRKAKNRRAGAKRRIYEFVNTSDRIDIVLKGISGEITNLSIWSFLDALPPSGSFYNEIYDEQPVKPAKQAIRVFSRFSMGMADYGALIVKY